MKDRIVQHANRYKLTSVSGDIYDLTPEPGIVTEPGTDLNKANILSDATVVKLEAALGVDLPADPTINDVFGALAIPPVKYEAGTYTGTDTFGADNPNTLTFGFVPKIVIVSRNYRAAGLSLLVLIHGMTLLCGYGAGTGGSSWNGAASFYWQNVAWNDATKSVSWYTDVDAAAQGDISAQTYHYLAIG